MPNYLSLSVFIGISSLATFACPPGLYCGVGSVNGVPCPPATYRGSPGGGNEVDACAECPGGYTCAGAGTVIPTGEGVFYVVFALPLETPVCMYMPFM